MKIKKFCPILLPGLLLATAPQEQEKSKPSRIISVREKPKTAEELAKERTAREKRKAELEARKKQEALKLASAYEEAKAKREAAAKGAKVQYLSLGTPVGKTEAPKPNTSTTNATPDQSSPHISAAALTQLLIDNARAEYDNSLLHKKFSNYKIENNFMHFTSEAHVKSRSETVVDKYKIDLMHVYIKKSNYADGTPVITIKPESSHRDTAITLERVRNGTPENASDCTSYVEILLEGNLEAVFKELQRYTDQVKNK